MLIPKEVLSVVEVAAEERGRYVLNGLHLERGEDGKARAIATDGHKMIVVVWDDSKERAAYPAARFTGLSAEPVPGLAVTLDPATLKEIRSIAPKLGSAFRDRAYLSRIVLDEVDLKAKQDAAAEARKKVEKGEDHVAPVLMKAQFASTDLVHDRTVQAEPLQGTYPKWDAVFPNYDPATVATFHVNAEYLVTLLQALLKATPPEENELPIVKFTVPRKGDVAVTITREKDGREATGLILPVKKLK